MINAEQIPDEVVEAFVDAYYAKDMTRKAAISAALNAWPDVRHSIERNGSYPVLILPLTQEPST
jgi:ribonuclease PH